jgi:phosphoribosyl-ATP pyrophosphohydrolase
MIVPSIDLQSGRSVQLVGGRDKVLDAGDPVPLARRFGRVGEVAVVDLDAALGRGDNTAAIDALLPLARCRVGGGIRDVPTAIRWLDAGAAKVVLGTAATPDVLTSLPSGRLVVALDARDGEVVVDGWRRGTGRGVVERMEDLRGLCGEFLVTCVEREGRLAGVDLELAKRLRDAAAPARLTLAGGVASADDVAALDRLGIDAQVGMALYTGKLDLAGTLAAVVQSDRDDGLLPTVVTDERGGALGLVYSNARSLQEAIAHGEGVYWSRRRGLWRKGETSGATQELLRIDVDCDRDCLRFVVHQRGGGFCHTGAMTCFGPDRGLDALLRRLAARVEAAPPGSYTGRLLTDPGLLQAKLVEEAGELAAAANADEATHEAADGLYFTAVAMVRAGIDLPAVERELDRRALRVTRRPGEAKPVAGEFGP